MFVALLRSNVFAYICNYFGEHSTVGVGKKDDVFGFADVEMVKWVQFLANPLMVVKTFHLKPLIRTS